MNNILPRPTHMHMPMYMVRNRARTNQYLGHCSSSGVFVFQERSLCQRVVSKVQPMGGGDVRMKCTKIKRSRDFLVQFAPSRVDKDASSFEPELVSLSFSDLKEMMHSNNFRILVIDHVTDCRDEGVVVLPKNSLRLHGDRVFYPKKTDDSMFVYRRNLESVFAKCDD